MAAVAVESEQRGIPAGSEARWTLGLTLLWIAGIPTLLAFADDALAPLPALNASRALFAVLVAGLAGRVALRPRSLARPGLTEAALGLYLAVMIASWVATVPDKGARALAKDGALLVEGVVMPCAAFLFARQLAWTPQRIRVCLWILVAGVGLYLVAAGTLDVAFGSGLFRPRSRAFVPSHVGRAMGPFSNAFSFGMVTSILLLLALCLALHAASRRARVALWGMAGGLLLGVVLSQGRSVWLSLPVALLFVARSRPQLRRGLRRGILPAALAAGIAVAVIDVDTLATRATAVGPLHARVVAWATAVNAIAHHPLLGLGFGASTFARARAEYATSWGDVPVRSGDWVAVPHNEFLHVALLTGAVGLAAYLLLLAAIWRLLRRARAAWAARDPFRADLALFLQAALLMLLVNGLFLDLMYLSYVLILFFFLLGIAGGGPRADHARIGSDRAETP